MTKEAEIVFDKSKVEEIFGQVPPIVSNALIFLYKEGRNKKDPKENAYIKISETGNDVKIILPDGRIRYEDGLTRSIDRTSSTKARNLKGEDGKTFEYFNDFSAPCCSQFQTANGVIVTVEVPVYDFSKPLSTGEYAYHVKEFRQLSIGTKKSFLIPNKDAAVYYFFLFSHWNARNPFNARYKTNQSNAQVFIEQDKLEERQQAQDTMEQMRQSLNFHAIIKDDAERITEVARKFNEQNSQNPFFEMLAVGSRLSEKRQAIEKIAMSPQWIPNFLHVRDTIGEFKGLNITEVKTKIADGMKLGVLYLDEENLTLELNHKVEDGLFATAFEGTTLKDNSYIFYKWEKKEDISLAKYCDYVFEQYKDEWYQILFAVIAKEVKKYDSRNGESPNWRQSMTYNKFVGTNNTWAVKK